MGLRLGGSDYRRTNVYMEVYGSDKRERIGSTPLWACRQCGGTVWYMALHDDICPRLATYASEDDLQASRERS